MAQSARTRNTYKSTRKQMIDILAAVISLLLFAAFKVERDKIRDHPKDALFQSNWWLGINQPERSWLLKHPLSFLYNGWHHCESWIVAITCNIIGYFLFRLGHELVAYIFIPAGYIIVGAYFNYQYHKKRKRL